MTVDSTKQCLVCGDRALGLLTIPHFYIISLILNSQFAGNHFGSICCESCKSFFVRSAQRMDELACVRYGRCDVTLLSRRECAKCRLVKCFKIGMNLVRIFYIPVKFLYSLNSRTTPDQQRKATNTKKKK